MHNLSNTPQPQKLYTILTQSFFLSAFFRSLRKFFAKDQKCMKTKNNMHDTMTTMSMYCV